jgi:membrane protein DedA with SNARE-associated domain
VSDLATMLVAWLAVNTYPVAALTVLVGAIGVPLPSAVIVLAAGSISTTTDGDPELSVLFGVILVAAVVGDIVSYSLGRWGSQLVLGRVGARIGLTPERIAAAEHRFERWGGLLVVVTRCLLTGLALPTNLAAGASGYPLVRFFGYAVFGEALWTGGYLGLGWLFGPGWVSLLDYLDDAVTVLTTLAVAIVLVLVLVHLLRSTPTQSRRK